MNDNYLIVNILLAQTLQELITKTKAHNQSII